MSQPTSDDHVDDLADQAIMKCLNLTEPKSFFLFAGAGSGKTRSLVGAVDRFIDEHGSDLRLSGQKIGIITYTNKAADEIRQRLKFDWRVTVRTIHAFAWSLIGGYNHDIRKWLAGNLAAEIAELEDLIARGRAGTKAAVERARSLEAKQRRLASLPAIKAFVYSPTGDNRTRDSLNHAEVIKMTAEFLTTKSGLRNSLVAAYPVLLIDESQDTNAGLMDALFSVEAEFGARFSLGLFGDMMQRIYNDGKAGLAEAVPDGWEKPAKKMNHRCPKRVIELINLIRKDDDGQEQQARSDAPEGIVRLFLFPENVADRPAAEQGVRKQMAEITDDQAWVDGPVKTLALEHAMAARRFGFHNFFAPLYRADLGTGLLDGTGPGIGLFARELAPLVKALLANDKFAAANIVRKSSPLLSKERLKAAGNEQLAMLRRANAAAEVLKQYWDDGKEPTLADVLQHVATTQIFAVPDVLKPFVEIPVDGAAAAESDAEADDEEDAEDERVNRMLGAWREALQAPFSEIERYRDYVDGLSPFDTHQGVKGLEFPRVMVVLDDREMGGFMFSYEKLMGAKVQSDTDKQNEAAGKDSSIHRTRRLFYVTCSRAEQGLAVVNYTAAPSAVRSAMIQKGWFKENEIIARAD